MNKKLIELETLNLAKAIAVTRKQTDPDYYYLDTAFRHLHDAVIPDKLSKKEIKERIRELLLS